MFRGYFKKAPKTLALLLLLSSLPLVTVHADDILVVADEWCPYNCAQDSNAPGYIVELAKRVFEREGHRVVYEVVPWARAIAGVRNGIYDAIIGAGKDEVPDFIFTDQEIGHASHRFYVKQSSAWTYSGLDSLQDVNLGVIKDYSYGTLFNEYIKPNENNSERITVIAGNDALTRSIQMLSIGRTNVLVEDRNVINQHFAERGVQNPLKEAGIASNEAIYIAFSPAQKQSSQYALILDRATRNLKDSKVMKDLLNKYGLVE